MVRGVSGVFVYLSPVAPVRRGEGLALPSTNASMRPCASCDHRKREALASFSGAAPRWCICAGVMLAYGIGGGNGIGLDGLHVAILLGPWITQDYHGSRRQVVILGDIRQRSGELHTSSLGAVCGGCMGISGADNTFRCAQSCSS